MQHEDGICSNQNKTIKNVSVLLKSISRTMWLCCAGDGSKIHVMGTWSKGLHRIKSKRPLTIFLFVVIVVLFGNTVSNSPGSFETV